MSKSINVELNWALIRDVISNNFNYLFFFFYRSPWSSSCYNIRTDTRAGHLTYNTQERETRPKRNKKGEQRAGSL